MLLDYHKVKEKHPLEDQMPQGYICPGYDVEMMEVLAVLQYLYGIETQWSCQGNHRSGDIYKAYILIAPNNKFPKTLIDILKKNKFYVGYTDDYNDKGEKTGLTRQVIRSTQIAKDCKKKNPLFVKALKKWAIKEIKNHIIPMKNKDAYYYQDVVKKYL